MQKKIIAEDREDFKRWSMALRTTEKILKYDRPSIFWCYTEHAS